MLHTRNFDAREHLLRWQPWWLPFRRIGLQLVSAMTVELRHLGLLPRLPLQHRPGGHSFWLECLPSSEYSAA